MCRPARLRAQRRPGRVLDVIEHADHLADWLNAADVPSVAMLGNSFGYRVAIELAVRHPDRLAALVLVDSTMDPSARTRPGRSSGGCGHGQGGPLAAADLVRDVRDAGPGRVVGTWLCPATRSRTCFPRSRCGAGHPGQPRTHRAAGLGADRHLTPVSPGLRRAARVRVGAAGGAAELQQSSCQRHRRLLWTLVSARRPWATSPGWL
jgi:pimeloyl-ACP methyl ester carboxylesterase